MRMKSLILFFTPFVLDKYLMVSLQGSTYKEIYIDFFYPHSSPQKNQSAYNPPGLYYLIAI